MIAKSLRSAVFGKHEKYNMADDIEEVETLEKAPLRKGMSIEGMGKQYAFFAEASQ